MSISPRTKLGPLSTPSLPLECSHSLVVQLSFQPIKLWPQASLTSPMLCSPHLIWQNYCYATFLLVHVCQRIFFHPLILNLPVLFCKNASSFPGKKIPLLSIPVQTLITSDQGYWKSFPTVSLISISLTPSLSLVNILENKSECVTWLCSKIFAESRLHSTWQIKPFPICSEPAFPAWPL